MAPSAEEAFTKILRLSEETREGGFSRASTPVVAFASATYETTDETAVGLTAAALSSKRDEMPAETFAINFCLSTKRRIKSILCGITRLVPCVLRQLAKATTISCKVCRTLFRQTFVFLPRNMD